MKTAIALVLALGMSAGAASLSATGQADGKKYEKGATVTLQGCVTAAEAKDTWVLTNVQEWPVSTTDMGKFGKRYYWLDKLGKDLRQHGGHTIQVTGKIDEVSLWDHALLPTEISNLYANPGGAVSAPEPASFCLLAGSAAFLVTLRRRRHDSLAA